MNILQINYSDHYRGGGAALAMYRLNSQLNKMGVTASVLSAFKTDEHVNSEQIGRYYRIESRIQKLMHWLGLRNIAPLISTYNIKNYKLYKDADIIHFNILHNDYFSYPIIPFLTKNKPAVCTLHDMWNFTGHCSYSYDCAKWQTGCGKCPYPDIYPSISRDSTAMELKIKKWVYDNSNITFVADSKWLADQADKSILSKHNIRHIPYGLDTDVFIPKNKDTCRKQLNLPLDKHILMFSAVDLSDYRKGGDLLLKILESLPDVYKMNTLLLIIGAEPNFLKCLKDIEHIELGFIDDDCKKSTAYSAADIFILTSRAEAFGIVLMESVSCGTPVIAFDVGGVTDIARHEITGLVARENNVDDFRNCIIRLVDDHELRSNISANCRSIAVTEYKIETEAKRYIELYESIINQKLPLHQVC